jgi:hypothetical protein
VEFGIGGKAGARGAALNLTERGMGFDAAPRD